MLISQIMATWGTSFTFANDCCVLQRPVQMLCRLRLTFSISLTFGERMMQQHKINGQVINLEYSIMGYPSLEIIYVKPNGTIEPTDIGSNMKIMIGLHMA